MPSASTMVLGVIGCPVEHSLSPAMHMAAIAALGLDATYLAFHVEPAGLRDAIAGMRALGIRGLNATIPHKDALVPLMDELDHSALAAGCVNTVTNEQGRLVGSSTDGPGFLRSLAEEGVCLDGGRVVVAGSGGSARAIAFALGRSVASLHLAARNEAARESLAEALAQRGIAVSTGNLLPSGLGAALRDASALVNTTPLGMWPETTGCIPVDPESLRQGLIVVDIVYTPQPTRLLRIAREAGCRTLGGVGMLVHQGAIAFERWTGRAAPVTAMRAALKEELRARSAAD